MMIHSSGTVTERHVHYHVRFIDAVLIAAADKVAERVAELTGGV